MPGDGAPDTGRLREAVWLSSRSELCTGSGTVPVLVEGGNMVFPTLNEPDCDVSFLLLSKPGRRPSRLTCAGPDRDDRLVFNELRPRDSTRDVSPDVVVGKTIQRSNADASLSVRTHRSRTTRYE